MKVRGLVGEVEAFGGCFGNLKVLGMVNTWIVV